MVPPTGVAVLGEWGGGREVVDSRSVAVIWRRAPSGQPCEMPSDRVVPSPPRLLRPSIPWAVASFAVVVRGRRGQVLRRIHPCRCCGASSSDWTVFAVRVPRSDTIPTQDGGWSRYGRCGVAVPWVLLMAHEILCLDVRW